LPSCWRLGTADRDSIAVRRIGFHSAVGDARQNRAIRVCFVVRVGLSIADPQPGAAAYGSALAVPLTDGVTTNIRTVATATDTWRQATDFGDAATFIARRVSWSSDGRSIVSALGKGDANVVLFDRKPQSAPNQPSRD